MQVPTIDAQNETRESRYTLVQLQPPCAKAYIHYNTIKIPRTKDRVTRTLILRPGRRVNVPADR